MSQKLAENIATTLLAELLGEKAPALSTFDDLHAPGPEETISSRTRKKQVTEMKPKSFTQLYGEAKKQDAYWVADAIYTFTEELHNLAEIGKVSRVELARRMDVSPAYITKIFRGDVNFTVDTMVRLARRVGARLQLHLVPEEIEAYLFNWNSASIEWQKELVQ